MDFHKLTLVQEKFSFTLLKTAGSTFINRGVVGVGAEAMSIRSVSLALFSTNDSVSGMRGFARLGSRGGMADDMAGAALTR